MEHLIYRRIYRGYRQTSALGYWLMRRFTPAGLCVAGGWLAVGFVGVDIENTVSYQAFALLLAFLVFAVASSGFFRAKFQTTRLLPRFGTVEEPLPYQVRVRNLSAQPQIGLTLLEDLEDPRPPFAEWLAVQRAENRRSRSLRIARPRPHNPFRRARVKAVAVAPLPAHSEVEVLMELMPLRRGVLRFTGITVARPDWLGLFRAFSRTACPQTVLILPRRYPLPPIALPGQSRYQPGGVALAANVGCSDEFVSLRDYRQGDPLRHIHWRSWARTGKPIVKEFEDEFFVRHALILDTFTDAPHSPVLEAAVSVAASFACTVLTQESLLDLLFIGQQSYCFTAGRGLGSADQMLEILAAVQNCPDQPFSVLENLVLNHLSVVSGCICVLQQWDEPRRQFVAKLKALQMPLMVLLIVPPGGGISGAGGDLVGAEGTLHVVEVGNLAEGLAKLA